MTESRPLGHIRIGLISATYGGFLVLSWLFAVVFLFRRLGRMIGSGDGGPMVFSNFFAIPLLIGVLGYLLLAIAQYEVSRRLDAEGGPAAAPIVLTALAVHIVVTTVSLVGFPLAVSSSSPQFLFASFLGLILAGVLPALILGFAYLRNAKALQAVRARLGQPSSSNIDLAIILYFVGIAVSLLIIVAAYLFAVEYNRVQDLADAAEPVPVA